MTYRRADHERWQQMDFVLGIKIELSNQHPVTDICDFVQGDYPKDFVFDGWHPQCFCYATPILISEDEMAKVSEAFARGETYIPKGKPVTDTPKGFKKWVKDHKEQIQGAKNPPYWVRNNKAVVNGIWREKNGKQGNLNWTSRNAENEGKKIYSEYDSTTKLSNEQVENAKNIKAILNDNTPLKPKDFYGADNGIPNELNGTTNCVNVCFANELLRRGINVSASDLFIKEIAADKYYKLFVKADGSFPKIELINGQREDIVYNKLVKRLKTCPNGRFILGGNDPDDIALYLKGKIKKDEISGHVITVEVSPRGRIIAYDHQIDAFVSLKSMIHHADITYGIEVLRIDNMLINENKEFIHELLQVRY